jgi:xylose isomerase
MVRAHHLHFAAINVNIKAEPEFRNGGLTVSAPETRKRAIGFIREAKDFAAAVGADRVSCCPLADGYEFAFQADYGAAWKRLVESVAEAGSYRPEIPLFIEPKPSETRGTCFVNNAAKALLLLKDVGNPRVGVTLDFGHSIYGGNNPPEEVALLAESGYPYYIHINDNDGRWDWDYFCGTKHFLEYAEFLWYLKKYGYADYMTSDTSPTRWDVQGVFEVNSRVTRRLWRVVERLDERGFARLVGASDYLATWRVLEEGLFGLKENA